MPRFHQRQDQTNGPGGEGKWLPAESYTAVAWPMLACGFTKASKKFENAAVATCLSSTGRCTVNAELFRPILPCRSCSEPIDRGSYWLSAAIKIINLRQRNFHWLYVFRSFAPDLAYIRSNYLSADRRRSRVSAHPAKDLHEKLTHAATKQPSKFSHEAFASDLTTRSPGPIAVIAHAVRDECNFRTHT